MGANNLSLTVSVNGVQAAEARLRSLAAGIGRMNQAVASLAAVGRAMPALFAAISAASGLGALGAFVKTAIDTADSTNLMAQRAGQAVEGFSELSYVSKLAEVSQGDLVVAMRGLSDEMVKQGRGGESLRSELLSLADVFAKMPDGPGKLQFAIDKLGKSGQALIPLLNQGGAAINDQMKEAREFGQVIGPAFGANADQFNDNLDRIGAMGTGVFLQVASKILPELNRILS